MGRMWADPEALIAASALVQRDYGSHGYRVVDAESPGFSGGIILKVRASDGGQFYVAATRYGMTCHGDDKERVAERLRELYRQEVSP